MLSRKEAEQLVDKLRSNISPLFPSGNMDAILFGSYARGDEEPGSDIDVLFLVDASRQEISQHNWEVGDVAADFLLNYGVVVSPIIENRNYFNTNSDTIPLFRNIQREGVVLNA